MLSRRRSTRGAAAKTLASPRRETHDGTHRSLPVRGTASCRHHNHPAAIRRDGCRDAHRVGGARTVHVQQHPRDRLCPRKEGPLLIDANKLLTKMSDVGNDQSGYKTETSGDHGYIETPGIPSQDADFDTILLRCGFDPDVFEIDGPPKVKRREAQTPDGVEWLSSSGIRVREQPTADARPDHA